MAARSTGVQINYRLTHPEARSPGAPTRRPLDLQAMETFARMPLLQEAGSQEYPLLTNASIGTEDNVANISSLARAFMPESTCTQLAGITTCLNTFQGWWAARCAKKRFEAAFQIHDKGGMIEGGIDTVRGVSQSLGGAAYVGLRGATIATDLSPYMAIAAPPGWIAQAFGVVSEICFTVFYSMIALWSAYCLRKDLQLGTALNAANKDGEDALVQFLKDKTCADPKKKLTALTDTPEKIQQLGKYKEKLQKTALDVLTGQFLSLQDHWEQGGQLQRKKPLSTSEAREHLRELFTAHDARLRGSSAWNHYVISLGLSADDSHLRECNFSMLELIGFKLEEGKRQCKKKAKFSRVTDEGCAEAVQKAVRQGLKTRLASSDPVVKGAASQELESLGKRVKCENGKTRRIHSALLAIGVIGAIVSLVGFAVLAHPVAIALAFLGALVNIGLMAATDGYFLNASWDNGPPGIHDKKYLATIAALFVVVIAISLSVTIGFGLPLLPCLGACAVGGSGLMLTGYSYHRVVQKEKKWHVEHPDLKAVGDTLAPKADQNALDDETLGLFKKLPKAERRMIRKKYIDLSRQGEMVFKTQSYQIMDWANEFGAVSLLSGPSVVESEHQLRVRGIKKTVKSCWEDYEKSRDEQNRVTALRMQALYDSVVQRQTWEHTLQKIHDVKRIPGAWTALTENIWYVTKRQENIADLKRAVAAATEQRRSSAVTSANPLSTHQITALAGSAA